MTHRRKVYNVKRYSRRRRQTASGIRYFIADRKWLFSGIAAAIVVVVVLYSAGILNHLFKTGAPEQSTQTAATDQTAAPSASAPAVVTDQPSASPAASALAAADQSAAPTDAPAQSSGDTSTQSPAPSETPEPSATPSPSASSKVTRVLQYTKPNMQGDDVKALQQKLGLPVDGYFGQSTDTAVRNFQKAQGLTPDGVVGSSTLSKLGLQ